MLQIQYYAALKFLLPPQIIPLLCNLTSVKFLEQGQKETKFFAKISSEWQLVKLIILFLSKPPELGLHCLHGSQHYCHRSSY